jgi:hypothetical protein
MNAGSPVVEALRLTGASSNKILNDVTATTSAPSHGSEGVSTIGAISLTLVWVVTSEDPDAEVLVRVWRWSLSAQRWTVYSDIPMRKLADTSGGAITIEDNSLPRLAFQVIDITASTTIAMWAEKTVLR